MSDIGRREFVALSSAAALLSMPHRRGVARETVRAVPGGRVAGGVQLDPAARVAVPGTRPAQQFVDSVGVNVHWTYDDTPYGARYAEVRQRLVELGVRFVRGETRRALDLFDVGVRTLLLVDPAVRDQRRGARTTSAMLFDEAEEAIRARAVYALEGANEPDLAWRRWNYTYGEANYIAGTVKLQREIWTQAQRRFGVDRPIVYGPAVGGTYWGGGNPFTGAGLGSLADAGAFHPYPARNTFTSKAPYAGIPDYYWRTDFPSSTLDVYPVALRATQSAFPGLPMVATESGWSTFNLGPEESVHAAYTVRLYLESFRLKIPKMFLYELVDEFVDPAGTNREAHFGLLRHDLSPKAAYWAVQGMLANTRQLAAPREAPVALTPAVEVRMPAGYSAKDVHGVRLDRGNGLQTLAVWRETASQFWNVGPAKADRVAPQRITHPESLLTVTVPAGGEVESVGEHAPTGVVTVRPVHAPTTTVPLRDYPVYVHVRTR